MDFEEERKYHENLKIIENEISNLEQYLAPFFNSSLQEKMENLTALEQTKLNIAISYAINALYYIYLKLNGISPNEHAVKGELDRVRLYIQKLKDLKEKEKQKANVKLNVEAANRFITHALSGFNNENKTK